MALEPIVDAEVYVKFNLPDGWNIITLWDKEGYMALGDYRFYEGVVDPELFQRVAISKSSSRRISKVRFVIAVANSSSTRQHGTSVHLNHER